VVDQMRGGLDHPSRPAGWAEATALTREGNKVLVTTAVALNSNESVFEASTAQVERYRVLQRGRQQDLFVVDAKAGKSARLNAILRQPLFDQFKEQNSDRLAYDYSRRDPSG